MWAYLEPIVEERLRNPGDDLLSKIATAELDGQRMSMDEVKGFIALLLAAGGDTTDKAIANMWYHMLYTRPDQFEDVKKDPTLWENVFAEMMRYDAVVHVQSRFTTREVQIRTSSGSSRLDQAAKEAVDRWRFVPARQGDEAVGAWVLVPISFQLEG